MAASLDRDPVSWSCRDRISDADRAFTRKRRVGGDLLLSFGGFASVDLTSRRIRPKREADGQRRDRIAFPRAETKRERPSRVRHGRTDGPSDVERDGQDHQPPEKCERCDPFSPFLTIELPNAPKEAARFGQPVYRPAPMPPSAAGSGFGSRESYSASIDHAQSRGSRCRCRRYHFELAGAGRSKHHRRPPNGRTNAARVLVTFRSGRTINLSILVESRRSEVD